MNSLRAALLALLAVAAAVAHSQEPTFAGRPEVQAFIRDLVARHAFEEGELQTVFSRARREDGVLTAMRTQPELLARSWETYRATFVNERLVKNGTAFWQEHRRALERARRAYGVPEEIIVAIIGVETFYGRNTGRWRVIDALATLAFDYPPRSGYFRGELENFLLFARDLNFDVFDVKGSYAGAIGIPQFMPTSYLRYAVDFNGDGVADLRGNAADAIGSVGNFLKQHGWRPGEPVQRSARVSGEGFRDYADGNPLPRHTLEELKLAGVAPRGAPLPAGARASLLELNSPERPAEYRLGLQNLYVLTRYNRSLFYALTVADLADALRAARARTAAR
ncbi:MAG TPA: lytic murein transglycosylase B [Burkholderiales bacterium]|nr:lytic murein transglycosylase B [Burkholderiales bacterium]